MNKTPTLDLLSRVLDSALQRDYKGYNKHDGLLSPLLRPILGGFKLGRLVAIQTVMRAPLNIRPWVGVPKSRNPKGIGLFVTALLHKYSITREPADLAQAKELLAWLEQNKSSGFPGISWGYQYPWQDVGFFAPAHFPNRVVTCWIGFAFFNAWEQTAEKHYLDVCIEICRFLLDSPNRLVETENELCFSYVPDASVTWAVMDVSALTAKMLAQTGKACGNESFLADSRRCMRYIMNRQTEYGAWFYTDPPGDSHITHDNYHTGIILDCILDTMLATGEQHYAEEYRKGLEYYAGNLFTPDAAPKWMNNSVFPHNIHGASQGIITFSKAAVLFPEYLEKADRILEWTQSHLYNRKTGEYWYQRTRLFTTKYSLMRWCNAWMAVALATRLVSTAGREKSRQ